jgi:hypothetical protein
VPGSDQTFARAEIEMTKTVRIRADDAINTFELNAFVVVSFVGIGRVENKVGAARLLDDNPDEIAAGGRSAP